MVGFLGAGGGLLVFFVPLLHLWCYLSVLSITEDWEFPSEVGLCQKVLISSNQLFLETLLSFTEFQDFVLPGFIDS